MDSIGGYRLVRKLGTGARADVWLGHGGTTDAGTETVAVKAYRAGAAQADIDTEIEALARSSHRHLLRLEDLATAPDGLPSLILQRLSAVSLGSLLAAGPLPLGEAVTVLAPLALAVAELHRVGVTHGGIRPSAVLFDTDRAPVLARFGSAGIVGDLPLPDAVGLPAAQLAAATGVADDLAQLLGVVRATLGEATSSLGGTFVGQDREFAAPSDPQAWVQDLADRLFRLATSQPVCFTRRAASALPSPLPSRIGGMGPVDPGVAEPVPAPAGPWRDALALLHLPDSLLLAVAERLDPLLESGPITFLLPRLRKALGAVRKPVWIAAGGVALTVVAAIALVPGGSSDAGAANPSPGFAVTESAPTPGSPVDAVATMDPAILADDPLAAGIALLVARSECQRVVSILCLDGVDQPGSAAIESDAYRIRNAQEGGVETPEPSLAAIEATLVDRLGDTALVSLERAGVAFASLLLVKSEQGWRIRDLVFADEPGSSESP